MTGISGLTGSSMMASSSGMTSSMLDRAHTYTDFSGLNALKAQARTDKSAALKEVAKQFESLFMSMVMKSMRDANKPFEEGNFMHSSQSDMYQEMFDSQLTLSMSKGRGMGLADSLYRQLSAQIGVDESGLGESGRAAMPGKYTSIQDYPRELPARVEKFVAAVVEIDELVSAKTEDLTKAKEATKVSGSTEENALEIGAELAESERPLDEQKSASPIDSNQMPEPRSFASAEEFVAHLYPVAKSIEQETGIDARFLLAQSALETGWGKHMIQPDSSSSSSKPSFNLFGIKADSRWSGASVDITTTEYREGVAMKEKAAFRSYDSYEDSFRDYVDFIKTNSRYSEAVEVMKDPEQFIEQLHKAGYATDPAYSEKVQRIFNSDLLQSALMLSQG